MSDDSNLAKRSLKAASWVVVFQFADQGIALILGVCMARLLCPSDYGILGVLSIFWALSAVFIQGGFAEALLQRKEITDVDLSSVFYYNMFLSLLCCGLMILSAPWIADFYREPILRQTILASAWTLPINALATVQRVILKRKLEQRFITLSHLVSALLSGILALFLAWRGYGVWALVWQSFALNVFSTFFVFVFTRWIPKLLFSWKSLLSLFKFGSYLMITGVIDAIFENVYDAVIGKFYSTETLGYYTRARSYSLLWPRSIQRSISSVLFPSFAKIQDDLPRLKRAYKRALCSSALVVIFPAFLLCVLSYPFVVLILTPKWLPCVPIWQLLTGTIIFWPIHKMNLQLLKARGRSDLYFGLDVVGKGFTVVSLIVLIFWGLYPMLVLEILTSLLTAYIESRYVGREIGYKFSAQISDITIYVILSGLACFGAWGFYRLIYPLSPWSGFVGGALVGCVLYVALNYLFKTEAFFDLLRLIAGKVTFFQRFLA